MKIDINHQCNDFDSYRAARVKNLFNVDSGANTHIQADLPIDDNDWQIGVIVGGSGTGKTTIGCHLWPNVQPFSPTWPTNQPIVDAICPDGRFDTVTAALASVGLGTVPAWLRPFKALSNGEQFRANLARAVAEAPQQLIIDEFSSVVDRQIACVGAGAFAKAWRRTKGQAVLLTCHYDVLNWIQPDWIYDTNKGEFIRGCLWQRPAITMEIYQTNWRYWPVFEKHHYLKMPHMIAATNYVATINGELVAHIAVSTRSGMVEARSCRLVIMPEWQGAGVGLTFLNAISELWLQGNNRYNKCMRTIFHTSHPQLAAALRRSPKWTQVSGKLRGDNKARSSLTMFKSEIKQSKPASINKGFGGHFRAVQGFRYLGSNYHV